MLIELAAFVIFAVFAFNVARWAYRGMVSGVWSKPIKSSHDANESWLTVTPENQYIRKTAMYIPHQNDRRM